MQFKILVEKLLNILEREITAEGHKNCAKRLIEETKEFFIYNNEKNLIENINTLLNDLKNIGNINCNNSLYKNEKKNILLHIELLFTNKDNKNYSLEERSIKQYLIELPAIKCIIAQNKIKHQSDRFGIYKNISKLMENASWIGNKDEVNNAQTISKISFFGLYAGLINIRQGTKIALDMIPLFPINKLFLEGNVIFGSSYFLRTLLFIYNTGGNKQLLNYTNDVFERLLAKIEIKQEKIFNFVYADETEKSFLILEQMRFNLLLLDISNQLNDLRFLNAALKSNDRLFDYYNKLKLSKHNNIKNFQKAIVAAYYSFGIMIQENLYNKVLYAK